MKLHLPDWKNAKIESTNELDKWILKRDLYFPMPGNRVLRIKHGFVTDCASIPRIARVFYTPHNPLWRAAAIIHDALYASELVTRSEADEILRDAMRQLHNNRIRRNLFYASVRGGGGFVWARHTPASIAAARKFVSILPDQT